MMDRSESEQNAEHAVHPSVESQIEDTAVEDDGEVTIAAALILEGHDNADDLDDTGDHDTSWWRSQRRFVRLFFGTHGATVILVVTALQAIATGCILPVVPHIMLERYQELHHYIDPDDTSRAEQEAQSAAAWSNAFYSLLSVIGNPILGSLSDTKGRRLVICGGLFLQVFPAIALCLVSMTSRVHPVWYYSAKSCTGVVSLLSLTFAALSDSFPSNNDRTAAFGLVLAVYFGGVHLAPALTLFLSETQVVIFSAGATLLNFAIAIVCLPETRESNAVIDAARTSAVGVEREPLGNSLLWRTLLWQSICRPFRDIAIVRRSKTLLLLAITSFLSAMVLASDTTLLIYYIENELHLSIHDFAGFMFALAIWGALVQGVLLQPMSQWLGEHNLLRFTFLCGGLQNALYGLAHTKATIFAGLLVSQFTKLNVPLFSLLVAQQAAAWEQGRMQGALFAVDALAKAIGPLWMEWVYNCTAHNGSRLGPGFMFLCAACVFVVGLILLIWLSRSVEQRRQDGRRGSEEESLYDGVNQLEEALLGENSTTDPPETRNEETPF